MARLSDSFSGIDVVPSSPHGLELYTTTGELESRITPVTGIDGIGNVNIVNDFVFDVDYLTPYTYTPGINTTLFFKDTVVTTTTATYNIDTYVGAGISAIGQQTFTTVGTSTWVVPANVTSISAVVVGGGGGGSYSTSGGGGGKGGDLRYAIALPVTPGETLTITVGAGGLKAAGAAGAGGFSDISRSGVSLLQAAGGGGGNTSSGLGANNGTSTTTGGNIGGGTGGTHAAGTTANTSGGGGAAGYSGNGGNSGVGAVVGTAGAGGGGGGGGGNGSALTAAAGGGVGILGEGANGTAGAIAGVGGGGSGGLPGDATAGGLYGGGGGGTDTSTAASATNGGQGAVRIIYGTGRAYPSTVTADQTTYQGLAATTASTYSTSTTVNSYETVRYPVNTLVKIFDSTLSYSTVTQVTSAGTGYITIATPPGFPTTETGSLFIQGASPTLYTGNYAFNSYLAAPRVINSAQTRYAASITMPNVQGYSYYLDTRQIAGTNPDIRSGVVRKLSQPLYSLPNTTHGKVSASARLKTIPSRLESAAMVPPKLVARSFNDRLSVSKVSTSKLVVEYSEPQLYKVDAVNKAKLLNIADVTSVSTLTNKVEELSQFDNIENLIQGPIYTITGQGTQSTNNTVLNYIFDEDIFVTSNVAITDLTLYFYNTNNTVTPPYPVGSYVTVFNNVGKFTAQVRAAGGNFVTLDLPYGYSNETYNLIASATLDVIPAIDYKPIIIGTSPRDRYYFSRLSPTTGVTYNDSSHALASDISVLTSSVLSKPISKLTASPSILSTDKLVSASVVRGDQAVVRTESLNKQLFKVSSDQVNLQYNQLEKPIANFKEIYNNQYLSTYINKFKVDQTQMFETPLSSKLIASAVVRADNTILKTAPVRSVTKLVDTIADIQAESLEKKVIRLYSDNTDILTVELLDPAKFKADMAEVFSLPISFNMQKQLTIVKSDNNTITTDMLQKPITALRTDNTIVAANTLKNMSPVLTDRTVLKSNEYITRLKVSQTQMFETPLSSKLSAMSRLVGTNNYHNVFKLTANAVLRNTLVLPQFFKEDRFKVDRTQVFFTPDSGKLKASAVVRAENTRKELGKLSASTVIRAPKVPVDISAALQKPVTKVIDLKSVINTERTEQFYAQADVYTTLPPTNARENLYYFNLAPGHRYNRTLEQGNSFALMTSTIESNRLESFDNVGLTDGPTYNITSQDTGQVANTVLEYIFDLDIFTAATNNVTALTLFFDNTNSFIMPYPVGSYVSITKTNDPKQTYAAQVIESTLNSVTTALPPDWDSSWTWGTISSASSFVYPRLSVSTTIAPTNPREMLYYAEMAPGYKTNLSIDQGSTIADTESIVKSGNLERDYYRLREAKDYLFLASIVKDVGVLKGVNQQLIVAPTGKILPRSNIRGIPQNLIQFKFGQVERVKWGINPNFGTRFAEVIRLEARGDIIRLKTGTFNKVHDVAVKKKDPIQFWN